MTSTPAAAQHLRDLALLRRVRDRIDREYAQPLDVEAFTRGARDGGDAAVRGEAGDQTDQDREAPVASRS